MRASAGWELCPIAALEELAAHWDAFNAKVGGLPFLRSQFLRPARLSARIKTLSSEDSCGDGTTNYFRLIDGSCSADGR